MDFKLGFGPMSKEIVNILVDYSNDRNAPLMIIASRNQVDAKSGYVMTTEELSKVLKEKPKNNILLCRDHCGPFFSDEDKNLNTRIAVEVTKKTIESDIVNGFDLIHIDTSRVPDEPYAVAAELIEFALKLNPNIKFEFGTEENIGVAAGLETYQKDINFAKNFPNMNFVVAQTGSLVYEDRQMGTFEQDIVKQLVDMANNAGVKLKEHNADYLTADEIKLRKTVGVHAMNIAPQLGVLQTKLTRRLLLNRKLQHRWEDIARLASQSGKWKKWIETAEENQRGIVAGHYVFNSQEYRDAIAEIGSINFEEGLKKLIYQTLDTYYNNFQ